MQKIASLFIHVMLLLVIRDMVFPNVIAATFSIFIVPLKVFLCKPIYGAFIPTLHGQYFPYLLHVYYRTEGLLVNKLMSDINEIILSSKRKGTTSVDRATFDRNH